SLPAPSALSLHDALPILSPSELMVRHRSIDSAPCWRGASGFANWGSMLPAGSNTTPHICEALQARPTQAHSGSASNSNSRCDQRSEEHTSELQSLAYLVC